MPAIDPTDPLIARLSSPIQDTIERIVLMLARMPQEKLEVLEQVVHDFSPEVDAPLIVKISKPYYQLQLVRRSQENSVDMNVDVE